MRYTTLNDLKKITKTNSGTGNPGIFLLPDNEQKPDKSFPPTSIFIDEGGDLILKFNTTILNNFSD